jgi:flagellar biosynthesis/type III secretory pathway protein FliH
MNKKNNKGSKTPEKQEKKTPAPVNQAETPKVDPVAAAKAKAEQLMVEAKAKAEKALEEAKKREQAAIEKAELKAKEAQKKAEERAIKAEERAKKKAEAQALKEANKYRYVPVTDLKTVKYSVAYELKGNYLMNSKLHNTVESALWTHKAIKRTGAPVFVVKVEVVKIDPPAAKK